MSNMHATHETKNKIDPIGENIQTIAELHKHTERHISPPQRLIEKVTDFLGQPRFLQLVPTLTKNPVMFFTQLQLPMQQLLKSIPLLS